MRWVLIWVCVCNVNPQVIYIANTKENCVQTRVAMYAREKGAYFCARFHPGMQAEEVKILNLGD